MEVHLPDPITNRWLDSNRTALHTLFSQIEAGGLRSFESVINLWPPAALRPPCCAEISFIKRTSVHAVGGCDPLS